MGSLFQSTHTETNTITSTAPLQPGPPPSQQRAARRRLAELEQSKPIPTTTRPRRPQVESVTIHMPVNLLLRQASNSAQRLVIVERSIQNRLN